MAVTVAPRDIVFTFPNSCNSVCCRSAGERLYINSNGVLESYKQRKAREDVEKAFNRSISHLNETLERRVVSFNGNAEVFQRKVVNILESIHALKEITFNHVEAINDLMVEYFEETKAGKEHVIFQDEVLSPSVLIEEPKKPEEASCLIL